MRRLQDEKRCKEGQENYKVILMLKGKVAGWSFGSIGQGDNASFRRRENLSPTDPI
jgi:hypothetical protein